VLTQEVKHVEAHEDLDPGHLPATSEGLQREAELRLPLRDGVAAPRQAEHGDLRHPGRRPGSEGETTGG
jgi:hypothetical protein